MSVRYLTGVILVAILGCNLVNPHSSIAAGSVGASRATSSSSGTSKAAARSSSVPAATPVNLTLSVSPYIVDVGGNVAVTVSARRWTGPATVTVSFLSPHHGFSGTMVWSGQCSCFRLNVFLAKRIHALELARVTATAKIRKQTYVRRTTFQVRGLQSNGKTFSPGGTPYLADWVSNPRPVQNEFVHFCAWTRALDAFPIPGIPVTFVVHYKQRTQKWFSGLTGGDGVRCSSKDIFYAKIGVPVTVDVYAGKLHGRTTFTPRSG